MGRKITLVTLPELSVAMRNFSALDPSVPLSDSVAKCLRAIAKRYRQNRPIVFYPLRDVAKFFGVSYHTAVSAFERLEMEGLLCCAHGAQTTLSGRTSLTRKSVRGIIAVPVYLPGFVIGTHWRAHVRELENRLRHHGFVADLIFFRQRDRERRLLTELLLEHKPDVVYWHVPIVDDEMTIIQIRDAGIPVVTQVGNGTWQPESQYVLDLVPGVRSAVTAWKSAGIDKVIIPFASDLQPQEMSVPFWIITETLKSIGLRYELQDLAHKNVEQFFSDFRTRPRSTGLVLMLHHWYEELCFRFPSLMASVFTRFRTLMQQEPVYQPYFIGKGITIDTIVYDAKGPSKRIADDIASGRALARHRIAVFEPKFHAGIDLGEVDRSIF